MTENSKLFTDPPLQEGDEVRFKGETSWVFFGVVVKDTANNKLVVVYDDDQVSTLPIDRFERVPKR